MQKGAATFFPRTYFVPATFCPGTYIVILIVQLSKVSFVLFMNIIEYQKSLFD